MSDLQEAIYRTVKLSCADAVEREQERIIRLLETERDTWQRESSFSYRNKLTELIAKIRIDK